MGVYSANLYYVHAHLILIVLLILISLLANKFHVFIVGALSVIWMCFCSFYLNDRLIKPLIVIDIVIFLGITILLYFLNSSLSYYVVKFDLLGKEVVHQKEEARGLLIYKEKMFNMILHDIKNPISRIVSATKSDSIRREDIVEPSKAIQLMLCDILAIRKCKCGNLELKLVSVDLSDVINNAINQVSYLLCEKKIECVVKNTNTVLEMDERLIERVFVNVLTNAIKFSKCNEKIDIDVSRNVNRVRAEIRDYGCGISAKDVDHIFGEYFQGRTQNSDNGDSTGIGLTFCKLVVEAHGGQIGVISKLSEGALVWFELPVKANEIIESDEAIRYSPKKYRCNENEDDMIRICQKKIANVLIYQTGELLSILDSSSTYTSPNFTYWKDEVIKTSMSGNVEYFEMLKKTGS